MTNPATAPSAANEPLRFACTHCGGNLEVPAVLAGVTGPCPLCGEITTAPRPENKVASLAPVQAPGAARLFAKPPPRRQMPPPLAPVSELRPPTAPVRTVPAPLRPVPAPEEKKKTAPLPVVNEVAAPVFPVPLMAPVVVEQSLESVEEQAKAKEEQPLVAPALLAAAEEPAVPSPVVPFLQPQPQPQQQQEQQPKADSPPRRQTTPLKERGIFGDSAASRSHLLDIHTDIPMGRRHGWRRWVDIGIVSVFTGSLLSTVAALRYTVPLEENSAPALPHNLTQLVEKETQSQLLRAQEAGALACAAVNRYLGAASEQAAASHLLPPPEGMAAPSFPPFLSPPAEWTVAGTKRIPLTDRYLAVVQPKSGTGPVFVVEQTESGPRLHAGPITQQSANLFEKFTATPGQGESTLYVEVRPTIPGHERDYRSGRPDLDSYRFVDVQSGFPGDLKAFIACFKPDSEAAKHFARHGAHDLNWRRALVQVRWQIHREAGPWVELVKFIPSPWSGDPPPPAPAATASASASASAGTVSSVP